MTALVSGPGPSLGAAALLGSILSVLIFLPTTYAAPVLEHQQHQVAEYYGETGCYYNFQHYEEGDRIITNEPCLNCTCHNRMLMCYLRVCPFSKAIGQDCTVEKKPEQCCPVITCPEVPVQLVTSSTTAATPPAPTSGSSAVGHPDNYGCTIDEVFYTDGAKVPGDPSKPCELCYCIRNRTACVMQECTLHVEGCQPVYADGVCCPVRYDCDYQEATEATLPETTVRPTPGLILTTTPGPLDCQHDYEVYADGAMLPNTNPCEFCYCMKGDIVCAVQECGTPLEREGKNCTALPPQPGSCCPQQYQCDNGSLPLDIMNQEKHPESQESSQSSDDSHSTTQATPVEPSVDDNEIDSPGGAIIEQVTSDKDSPAVPEKPETTDTHSEIPASQPVEEKVPEATVVEQEHEQTVAQVDQSPEQEQSLDSETEQENIPPSESSSPASIEHVKPAESDGIIQETTSKPEGSDGLIEQEGELKPEDNVTPASPSKEKPSEQPESQTSVDGLDTTKPTHLVTEPVEAETSAPHAPQDITTLPPIDEHAPHDHTKPHPGPEEVPEAPTTSTEIETQDESTGKPEEDKEPSETPIATPPQVQEESTQPPSSLITQAVESETSVPEVSQQETTVAPAQESQSDLDDQTKPHSPSEDKDNVGETTDRPSHPEHPVLPIEQESSTNIPETTVPAVDSSSVAEEEHEISLHPTETAPKEPETTEEPIHATNVPEIATNEPDTDAKPDSGETTPATAGETSAPEHIQPHEPIAQPTPSAPEPVESDDQEPTQETTLVPEHGTEIPLEAGAAVTGESELTPTETSENPDEHKPQSPIETEESGEPEQTVSPDAESPVHETSQRPEAVEAEPESKPEEGSTGKPEGSFPSDIGTTERPDDDHEILGTETPQVLPSDRPSTDRPSYDSTTITSGHEAGTETSLIDESSNVPAEENIPITTDVIKPVDVSTDSPAEFTAIPGQEAHTTAGSSQEHISDHSPPSESEKPDIIQHVTEAVIAESPETTDQAHEPPATIAPEISTGGSDSEDQGTHEESTLPPSPVESDENEPAIATSTEGSSISDTVKPEYGSSDTTELPSVPPTSLVEQKPEDTHIQDEHPSSESSTGGQEDSHGPSEHPSTEPVVSETETPYQPGEQSTQTPDTLIGHEEEKEDSSQSITPVETPESHHPPLDQTSDTAEGVTESGIKVTEKVDDLTSSEIITGGGIAGVATTVPEQGPEGIIPTDSTPAHGIVPGEGNCLVEGQSYQNNSAIPPMNPCVLSCRCVSSIVHCVKVTCSPPPAGHKNCIPVKDKSDACCNTYLCDGDSTPSLESDSHMAGGATTGDGKLPESTQESIDESATGVPVPGKPETSEESSSLAPEAVEVEGPDHPASVPDVSQGASESPSEGASEDKKPSESDDSELTNLSTPEPIESESPEYPSQHPDVHPVDVAPIGEEGASISQQPEKPEGTQEQEHPEDSGVQETLPDEPSAHPDQTQKPEQKPETNDIESVQQTLETDESPKPEDQEHPEQPTDIESSATTERPDEQPSQPQDTEHPVEIAPTGVPEIAQTVLPTQPPVLPVEAEIADTEDSEKPQTEQPVDMEHPAQPDNTQITETEIPEQPSVTEQYVTAEYPSSPEVSGKPQEPATEKPSVTEQSIEQEQPAHPEPEKPTSSESEPSQTIPGESFTSEPETDITERPIIVDSKPPQEPVEASESDMETPEHPEVAPGPIESEGDHIIGTDHTEEIEHSTQLPGEDHEISKPSETDYQKPIPESVEPSEIEHTGTDQPESQTEQVQTEQSPPEQSKPEEAQPVEHQPQEPHPAETHTEQPETESQTDISLPDQLHTEQPQPVDVQPEEPQTNLPHTDQPQTEQTQPEETLPEQAKPEEPQPVEVQTEQTQPQETLPEQAKPEEAQPVEVQTEQSYTEQPQTEQPQFEHTHPEHPQTGEPQPVEVQPDQSQPELPLTEQPQTELPQTEQSQTDESHTAQPKPVDAHPEHSITEQPQPAEPQTEHSQPEEPQTEHAQPEEPQTEHYQPEEPQTEQSQPEEPHPVQPKPEEPQPIEAETEQSHSESPYTEQPQTALPQELEPEHPQELHPDQGKPEYPTSGESQTEQSQPSTYTPTEIYPAAQEEAQTPASASEIKPADDHTKPEGETSEPVGPPEASEAEGSTTLHYPEEDSSTQQPQQSSPGMQVSTEDGLHIITSSPEGSGMPSGPIDGGSLTIDQDSEQSTSEPEQEGTTQLSPEHVEPVVTSSTESGDIGHVPNEPHLTTVGETEQESTAYPDVAGQSPLPQEPNVVETDVSSPTTDQPSHVPEKHPEVESQPSVEDGEGIQTTNEYSITTSSSQSENAHASESTLSSELPTPAPTTFTESEKDEGTSKPAEIEPEEGKPTVGSVEPIESEQPHPTETYPRPDVVTTHPSEDTSIDEGGAAETPHDKLTTTSKPQIESEGPQATEIPDKGEEPQMQTESVLDEKPTPGEPEPSLIDTEQPTSSSDSEKPSETDHAESEKPTPAQELETPHGTSVPALPSEDGSESEDHSETSTSLEPQHVPTTTPAHSDEESGLPEPVVTDTDDMAVQQKPVDQDQTHEQSPDKSPGESGSTTEKDSSDGGIEHVTQVSHPIEHATIPGEGLDTSTKKPTDGHDSGSSTKPGVDQKPQHPSHPSPDYENFNTDDGWYPPSTDEDWSEGSFGPGTCRYGGKLYVSAQQIPRDDPCDFCFCFRSDIICLRQSCPPPIPDCHQEPIEGFCCPRYQCEVSTATMVNVSTTTTTTTTTLPPHFLTHAYQGAAIKTGCQLQGKSYKVGEKIQEKSTPCLECLCGGNGDMQCNPRDCQPEPMLRKMIMAAASRRR